MRIALDFGRRLLALGLLIGSFLVFAGREIFPHIPNAALRSIAGTKVEELDALPPQPYQTYEYELEVMKELRARTPANAFFVVFYPNTFAYYADRRYMRDVDPRLVPFYRASTKNEGFAVLRRLHIQYVYLQSWSWPTVDHSRIREIVADPSLSTEIFEKFGYKVFRLADGEVGP
jgi:hypothetical protein